MGLREGEKSSRPNWNGGLEGGEAWAGSGAGVEAGNGAGVSMCTGLGREEPIGSGGWFLGDGGREGSAKPGKPGAGAVLEDVA